MKTTKLLLIMGLLVGLGACKKDKYQPVGDYGNANIISSNTVTANSWVTNFDDGTNFIFKNVLAWGEITQDILDNGIVMGYLQDGNEWIALPYGEDGDTYSYNFNFGIEVGTVNLYADGWQTPISPNPSDFNGLVFRFVAMTQETRAAHPDLDLNNYEDVKRVLKLKDLESTINKNL